MKIEPEARECAERIIDEEFRPNGNWGENWHTFSRETKRDIIADHVQALLDSDRAKREAQAPVSANYIAEVRPDDPPPSCHVCGAQMVPTRFHCLSCGADTEPTAPVSAPPRQGTCGDLTHNEMDDHDLTPVPSGKGEQG